MLLRLTLVTGSFVAIGLQTSPNATAQSLSASTLLNRGNTAMSIVNTSEVGMPIRLFTGPLGQILSLEIDSQGGSWVRGPLSIGQAIGAQSNEQVRIGGISNSSGTGLVISMVGTQQSTGIAVRDVGASGPDHAGIIVSSQANGLGTGIRLGGHHGGTRPSLQTGIDIVGGLGMRYNALTAGVGTGIEIGGTHPPRRGLDITVSGADHTGVVVRANTNGTGIMGASQSSTAQQATPRIRTGVMGYSASNSNLSVDTLIGVYGLATRGGNGGTQTQSIGIYGKAVGASTQHAGTTIGILGEVSTTAAGHFTSAAGCFLGDSVSLSLLALGGDVVLGGAPQDIPMQIGSSALAKYSTRNTTYMHDVHSTGYASMHQVGVRISEVVQVVNGYVNSINVSVGGVQTVIAQGNNAQIGGLTSFAADGRVAYLLVKGNPLALLHNDIGTAEAERFELPNQAEVFLEPEIVHVLWYDKQVQRWRIMR